MNDLSPLPRLAELALSTSATVSADDAAPPVVPDDEVDPETEMVRYLWQMN